jgi:hypothetical protein
MNVRAADRIYLTGDTETRIEDRPGKDLGVVMGQSRA